MSLRETKNRIKSVKNSEKITKAMKMVAASKLRKAQEAVLAPRPFSLELSNIISRLALKLKEEDKSLNPLLKPKSTIKNIELMVMTSDRGLCGALNSNAVRMAQRFIFDNSEKYEKIDISSIGKKGFEALSRFSYPIRKNYQPKNKVFDFDDAKEIASELCQRYIDDDIDAVFLIYNEFKSAITQNIILEQLLPVEQAKEVHKESSLDFLYEPSKEELLSELLPKHFATRLYQSFLESNASEQGARMTAMDNATRNAKEMTEKLTLQYNRARQASITKELMEIIGGAEAL